MKKRIKCPHCGELLELFIMTRPGPEREVRTEYIETRKLKDWKDEMKPGWVFVQFETKKEVWILEDKGAQLRRLYQTPTFVDVPEDLWEKQGWQNGGKFFRVKGDPEPGGYSAPAFGDCN